jgi:hypothetical protein
VQFFERGLLLRGQLRRGRTGLRKFGNIHY